MKSKLTATTGAPSWQFPAAAALVTSRSHVMLPLDPETAVKSWNRAPLRKAFLFLTT